jgi:hypothetical protein
MKPTAVSSDEAFSLNGMLHGKDKSQIKLVNFNYKGSFRAASELGQVRESPALGPKQQQQRPRRKSIQQIEIERTYMVNRSRRLPNSCSSGYRSSSSTSSCSSGGHSNDDMFASEYLQSTATTSGNVYSFEIETSTPLRKRRRVDQQTDLLLMATSVRPLSSLLYSRQVEEEQDTIGHDMCHECVHHHHHHNETAALADESTQVPVDSPVLIESTFNNSSLSNLSDDLIILQTAHVTTNTPRTVATAENDWNLFVIDKYAHETNVTFEQHLIPKWAVNSQLNLALASQFN